MKNGENYSESRRRFIKLFALSVVATQFIASCTNKVKGLLLKLSGTNHILGHRLWAKNFPLVTKNIKIDYLIIGGGITGLSAARQFIKKDITNFLIVELEENVGGNSRNGENQFSKYPLGAHYLPLPNKEDTELLQFLEESKIIIGFDDENYPIFDETQLTFDPQERLFYENTWHETVIPNVGDSIVEKENFTRFFEKMTFYREAKDDSGKYFFNIPTANSSDVPEAKILDSITMKAWCNQNNFVVKPLLNYIDYCCRDDFGLGIDFVSAWAGIHYFAARKQNISKNKSESVLNWPEGNARLSSHLQPYSDGKTLKNHLAFDIKIVEDNVVSTIFDNKTNTTTCINSKKIIVATPQFVNRYLIAGRKDFTKDFQYAPWLLATLVVSDLSDNGSFPLSWDNVIYGAKGLGYVYDQHQNIEQRQVKKVISYYHSFSTADLLKTRKEIFKKTENDWKKLVFDDLKIAHPNIEDVTESIDFQIIGHGMISPIPNFIFGESRKKASQSIDNKIFFAHTDLSGISVFEEAFHQGINVVNTILDETTMDS